MFNNANFDDMLRFLLILCFCSIIANLDAKEKVDSIHLNRPLNSKRLAITTGGLSTFWVGSSIGLWNVWYADHSTGKFHFFNDASDWLYTDKAGHVFTAYQLSKVAKKSFKWCGIDEKKSIWIGTAFGIGYQSTLEIMDGFSSGWGFSWADMASNSIGGILFSTQELIWKEQRILPKFSYHPTGYARIRPEVLGYTHVERLLKDYNGQTYWLSFSPSRFLKNSSIPKWICLSIGYSPDAKLVGDQNTYTDYSVNNSFTYRAKQQWLLSLDIDFNSLPIRRKWLKTLIEPLNLIKIPFPALILSNGKVNGNWLYF